MLDGYLEVTLVEQTELRRCVTVRAQGAVVGELWYEALPPVVRPFSATSLDFAAIALLPYAMHHQMHLSIVGPVSRSLLENLEEYQDAWVRWRPDLFAHVRVSAETLLDRAALAAQKAKAARDTVLAFSGGLDSIYALVANQTGALGLRSKPVATLVMTHGFDIPLQDEAAFEVASAKAASIGEAFGVPLQRVRTNWRAWSPHWHMTFGMGVSSVLQQFSGEHDTAVIAADQPYRTKFFVCGENAVTNRFMSSMEFPLCTVGLGATRSEKARCVGEYPAVRETIRVCWAGPDLGRNCGYCEKCVRTKLNFLAAGIGAIPALGDLDLAEVEALTTDGTGQLYLLEDILSAQPGLPPAYQAALSAVVARERAKYPAQP